VRHSIVIPYRNRQLTLPGCVASIIRSAEHCGIVDYEIVVVENWSDIPPEPGPHVRVVVHPGDMPVFNKSALMNLGIESSDSELVSIVDADAIVGAKWMRAAEIAAAYTKVCYRVWNAPALATECTADAVRRLPLAFEARERPDLNMPVQSAAHSVGRMFGNSQFTIARATLGGLRFNEAYSGRGYEDIEFNWRLWVHAGTEYSACLIPLPEYNMIHRRHPKAPGWDDQGRRDRARYFEDTERYINQLREKGVTL
jgi:hypothetical protein